MTIPGNFLIHTSMKNHRSIPGLWFHVVLTTYGAWLPGDERGFRTRRHREHVDGDYKRRPAPSLYWTMRLGAEQSLKHGPVSFSPGSRMIVGRAIIEKLTQRGAFALCIAVAAQHVHVLVKIPPTDVRDWCGHAKRHATFALRETGWNGKVWGARGKYSPVKDRRHQVNVYKYIINYSEVGAWVWTWKDKS